MRLGKCVPFSRWSAVGGVPSVEQRRWGSLVEPVVKVYQSASRLAVETLC